MCDYKLFVKRSRLPFLVLILLLMLFLVRHFISVNQNYEIKDLLSKYKISEEDGFDEYLFPPEEIETAVTVFTDIVIPEYVPERFHLINLSVEDHGDFYYARYDYREETQEVGWPTLHIYISNEVDEGFTIEGGYSNVIDIVEFNGGFITYHGDPFNDNLMALKRWLSGQCIHVSGRILQEEIVMILDGIALVD